MKKIAQLILLAGLLAQTQPIYAAGFLIAEQSVSSLGTANAANTAGAFDATTAFTNPAGMVFLEYCNESVLGVFGIIPESKYHNKETLNELGQPFPPASSGGNGGYSVGVPNIAYVKKIGCRMAAGLTINAPFGLVTNWDNDWLGRYYATRSSITTTNINPNLAVKVTDKLSFGGGFNALYFSTKLKNKIDFGLALGQPEKFDGKATLKGNTWGYGANLGLMYQLSCNTRLGVQWRSQVKINLNHADLTYDEVPIPLQKFFFSGRAQTKLTLPDIVSFGFWHKFCSKYAVMADFQWTHWNVLNKLVVTFPDALVAGPESAKELTLPLKWKDVWRFAVGGTYDLNCNTTLRAGYAYDQSPTPNDVFRSPRLPDQDRQWLSCGFQYCFSESLALDFAYAHLWVKNAGINQNSQVFAVPPNPSFATNGAMNGVFRTNINLVGASLRLRF